MNPQAFVPRDPNGILRVLVIGRVSTPKQDIGNIDAGYDYAEKILGERYSGPTHVKHLGEQGSGMRTDRATIMEACEEIETGTWDVVLMEDISKPYRNPRWIYAFIQDAVDASCRVIAPGDNLDTADDNWEVTLGAAALRHGLHIPDTRRRIRRTATHSFHKGGMVAKHRFGYRKLTKEEAASGTFGPKDLRIAKLPECTPIIQEMRRRRMNGQSRNAVADWLNDEGIAPGRYVARGKWLGTLVDELLRDRILSGTRRFRATIHEPIFKTGKHRRKKNSNPETEFHPELAHLTPEEQQELIDYLDAEPKKNDTPSPCKNRPRDRSPWPGQHSSCFHCEGFMYRTGTFLKCENAVPKGPRTCWNHVQVYYDITQARVIPWVLSVLDQYPQFRDRLIDAAWQEYGRGPGKHERALQSVREHLASLAKQETRLAEAIASGGELDALVTKLSSVTEDRKKSQAKEKSLMAQAGERSDFMSRDDVATRLEEAIMRLAAESLEFADLLRRLIPEFTIHLVQALDTPLIRPRAKLTMSFEAWCKNQEPPPAVSGVLDLFEPPLHIRHLPAVVAAKADPTIKKNSLKKIAQRLGINHMTVKRALDYARRMEAAGLTDPYREIVERPAQASRWGPRAPRN